ncbi:hypothetical protein BJX96DRAFT_152935 [Aspergillus floccosus]
MTRSSPSSSSLRLLTLPTAGCVCILCILQQNKSSPSSAALVPPTHHPALPLYPSTVGCRRPQSYPNTTIQLPRL